MKKIEKCWEHNNSSAFLWDRSGGHMVLPPLPPAPPPGPSPGPWGNKDVKKHGGVGWRDTISQHVPTVSVTPLETLLNIFRTYNTSLQLISRFEGGGRLSVMALLLLQLGVIHPSQISTCVPRSVRALSRTCYLQNRGYFVSNRRDFAVSCRRESSYFACESTCC